MNNNSEDFEFLSLKENNKNKSAKFCKANQNNIFSSQRNRLYNNEQLNTDIQFNENNKNIIESKGLGINEINNE